MSIHRLTRYINSKDLECCQKTTVETRNPEDGINYPAKATKGDVHIVDTIGEDTNYYIFNGFTWNLSIRQPSIETFSSSFIYEPDFVIISSVAGFPTNSDPSKVYYDKDTNRIFGTNGTFWVTGGQGFQVPPVKEPIHRIESTLDFYSYQFPNTPTITPETGGDTMTIRYANNIIVNYYWNGSTWDTIFIEDNTQVPSLRLRLSTPFNSTFTNGQTKDIVIRLTENFGVNLTGEVGIIIPKVDGFTVTYNNSAVASTNPVQTVRNNYFQSQLMSDGSLRLIRPGAGHGIPIQGFEDVYISLNLTATGTSMTSLITPILELGSGGSKEHLSRTFSEILTIS